MNRLAQTGSWSSLCCWLWLGVASVLLPAQDPVPTDTPTPEQDIVFWLKGEIGTPQNLTPELGLAWLQASEDSQKPSAFRRASEVLCLFEATRAQALVAAVYSSELDPEDLQNWRARIRAHFCTDLSGLNTSISLMGKQFPNLSLYTELAPYLLRWSTAWRSVPGAVQQPKEILDFFRLKKNAQWREVAEAEAYFYYLTKQPRKAMDALEKTTSSQARWLRHLILFELKQYPQIAASGECTQSQDYRLLELCVVAMLYAQQNDSALSVLQRLEQINPGNHHYLVQKGQVLLQLGRQEESMEVLDQAILAGNVWAIQLLAHIAENQSRPDDAADLYLSTPPGPFLISAMHNAVMVLLKNERLPEAARLLMRKSKRLGDNNPQLLALLGDVYLQLYEYSAAHNAFGRALKLDPQNTHARVSSYYSLFMLGKRTQALQQAEQLLKEFPNMPGVMNNFSYLLSLSGQRLDYARDLAEQALAQEPSNAFFYDTLGWVEFRAQNMFRALEHLETSWALDKNTEVGRHLGEVLWYLGRVDEARKIWSQTAAMYPPDPEVERLLEKYIDP